MTRILSSLEFIKEEFELTALLKDYCSFNLTDIRCKWDGQCFNDWIRENPKMPYSAFASMDANRNVDFEIYCKFNYEISGNHNVKGSNGTFGLGFSMHYADMNDLSDYEITNIKNDELDEFCEEVDVYEESLNDELYNLAVKDIVNELNKSFHKRDILNELEFYVSNEYNWEQEYEKLIDNFKKIVKEKLAPFNVEHT